MLDQINMNGQRNWQEFDENNLKVLQEYRDRIGKIRFEGDTRKMDLMTLDLIDITLDLDETGGHDNPSTPGEAAVKRFFEQIVNPYFLHPDPGMAELPVADLATRIRQEMTRISREDKELLQTARSSRYETVEAFVPQPIGEIQPEMPKPILNISGFSGSVLAEGAVSILTGEGGVAKSILALEIATILSHYGGVEAGLLQGLLESTSPNRPGNVLYLTYEDDKGVISKRYRDIISRDYSPPIALASERQFYVMEMAGHPLFGPADGGTFNRVQKLQGWDMLTRALAIADDWRLLIIDPALSAFVGNANDAPQVREFITQLGLLARKHRMGILVIAHTNKEARRNNGTTHDLFRAGQTGGSTHWTDAARGALGFHLGVLDDERQLIVTKANWGPSHIGCRVTIKNLKDRFGGFTAHPSGWQNETAYQAEITSLVLQANDKPDNDKRRKQIK